MCIRASTRDERQVRVFLTEEGKALQEKLSDVPARMLEAFGCGSESADRLQRDIAAVRDNVVSATRQE